MHCTLAVKIHSCQISCINNVVIKLSFYSQFYKLEMLLVLKLYFSVPVISWIESIGGGSGEPKVGQSIHSDPKTSAVASVCDINHKGG